MSTNKKSKRKDERNLITLLPKKYPGSTRQRPLLERFMEKVSPEPNTGCWLWQGAVRSGGYGVILRGEGDRRGFAAHRAAYELFRGDSGSLLVCHVCDNRACVNPSHLFLGTVEDNVADMWAKGRARSQQTTAKRRFTDEEVQDIRSKRLSQREFCDLYGVDKALVSRIVAKKLYKHV